MVHDLGWRTLRRQDGRARLVVRIYIRKGPRHDRLRLEIASPRPTARHVFDLVCNGALKVGAVIHSSHLEVHDDIERYAKTNAPLFIASCEVDRTFPREL
ncbi:hypothetical protein EV121DRAFT_291187 [Schizophyllum commune]